MASPPPPPLLAVIGSAATSHQHSHSSTIDNLKPSLLIIITILFMTFLICLLLRLLNRCRLRHVSPSSDSSLSSRRVSPDIITTSSIVDSLPLFTFSSVKRRSTSSGIAGDCAVCLSKFEAHDKLRLLPLCCHAFHAECIDVWLASNQTCPLCRSPVYASESDLIDDNSFRLEIGSISRRQAPPPTQLTDDQRRSYSIGSFHYVVDEDSEVSLANSHRTSVSGKEEEVESSLAADVGAGSRNWLKEYVDRLSRSLSSRALSFRSSGRFFAGSSRRSEVSGAIEMDIEADRTGEEISELFRWLSGV